MPHSRSRLASFIQGIRVLDLSRHLPGPLATLLLADMGAEVTKIEPPSGDEMRQIGPQGAEGTSHAFQAVNAGKTTRRLDLKSESGREAFLALAATADVLVESFRPGTMERLGLGAETLRAENPGLIYCALSGYGRSGPWMDRAGHDLTYLAQTGILDAMGHPGVPYPPPADINGGLFATIAILGALNARARDGKGCVLDLALADAPMPTLVFSLAELGVSGDLIGGAQGLLGGGAAYNNVYRTADDGKVALAAIEPKFWASFCRAAFRPDWLARQSEPLPQHALGAEIAAMFAALTLAEAVARFEPADCCFAPVAAFDHALHGFHATARGLLATGADGRLQALFPAVVDGQRPPPRPPLREL
jgi:crotonobetainyl-CoA:carnitine CoA-transferase CaiB-like acyl-CoA transferase